MPRLAVSPRTSRKLAEFLASFRGIPFYQWKGATRTHVRLHRGETDICCIGTTRRIPPSKFAPRLRSGVHYRIRRVC
jgi:hypothetical protein